MVIVVIARLALFEIICCSSCVECEGQGPGKKHITTDLSFPEWGLSRSIIIKTFVNQMYNLSG